jgi:hypothetical protein
MAVIIAQTRKELRQTIGHRSGAMFASATTSTGSTTSFIDTELPNADNSQNGKHFIQTSGANDGSIRTVDEYSGGSKTGRFRTAMSSSVASGVTYEIWDSDMPVARVHEFINAAVRSVTRKGAPPTTDRSIHSSRKVYSYTVPTAVVGVQRIEYRALVNREDIENCEAAWSESSDSDVTVSLDNGDYRQGSGALKLVVAGTVSTGDILASQAISADLTGMTHVEFWAKASAATAAADLALILSTTANAGTETEKLALPALVANTWTRCRVALANPHDDGAIISAGLEYDANEQANTVWLDGIEATESGTERWEFIHRNYWRIDKGQREIVFDWEGLEQAGYSRLKIIGAKSPGELSSDTDSCDIDPEYIINYALALVMRARADRNADTREAAHLEAERLYGTALDRMRRMQTPSGMRWVD